MTKYRVAIVVEDDSIAGAVSDFLFTADGHPRAMEEIEVVEWDL